MQRWVMLMAGLLATWSAFAEWTGEGELGLVLARGNSDNETVNARLKLVWEREQWVNETILSAVHSSESDETTASRYVLSNKTDYTLNKTSYLAGVVRYDRDRFSGFRFQSSAAVAYGRRLIDSEAHRLRVEIGPGLKYAESRATGESTSEAMLRGYTQYTWVMSTTANLDNRLLVEAASDNTFAENELALEVAINDRLALKAGLAVRHNTDVDPGREKTDTLTTANLVYHFGQ
ncbi:MAG: DUF481 domain-containing protein [Pseudomonadota bacterium]|nr:MAG: DUF481 domain-containing protein [Pseudomonadota bacterium]